MRRRIALIERIRNHIPRQSRLVRAFEPAASTLTVNRGLMRPTLRFVRHHGLTVGSGPFAGLRYPRSGILGVPGLGARLAGVYELELQRPVEELIGSEPGLVVNIGAGEGYYAVGLALRCPAADVIAFEADPYQSHLCAELTRLNGVADRVDLRGTCTTEMLAQLSPPPRTPVICDCEGGEETLIDPDAVEWLAASPMVIEAHETLVPGIEARLRERLAATHSVEVIEHSKRYVDDHPILRDAPGLSAIEREMLISELRHWHTPWLWAQPL